MEILGLNSVPIVRKGFHQTCRSPVDSVTDPLEILADQHMVEMVPRTRGHLRRKGAWDPAGQTHRRRSAGAIRQLKMLVSSLPPVVACHSISYI
jgi:hypothetical protein